MVMLTSTGPGDSSQGPLNFSLNGSHTYTEPGTYTIHATITDAEGHTANTVATVVVSAATLSAQVNPLIYNPAGQPTYDPSIVTIEVYAPHVDPSTISVTIDWGDGTAADQVPVSISDFAQYAADVYFLDAPDHHTYAQAGLYTVHVTITQAGNPSSPLVLTTKARVLDPSAVGVPTFPPTGPIPWPILYGGPVPLPIYYGGTLPVARLPAPTPSPTPPKTGHVPIKHVAGPAVYPYVQFPGSFPHNDSQPATLQTGHAPRPVARHFITKGRTHRALPAVHHSAHLRGGAALTAHPTLTASGAGGPRHPRRHGH
jgi:hypothetical protein